MFIIRIYKITKILSYIVFGCLIQRQRNVMIVHKNSLPLEENIIAAFVGKYSVPDAAIKLCLEKLLSVLVCLYDI